jgi:hypothetical protein
MELAVSLDIIGDMEKSGRTSLGNLLGRRKDIIHNNLRLRGAGKRDGAALYYSDPICQDSETARLR